MSLLDVRNLTVDLPTAAGWIRPVNDVSFQLAPAESLGLVGESGSGKTMLALALMGLLPPGARVGGTAVLEPGGANPRDLAQINEKAWRAIRGREIAMIFQEPMTSLNPVMRIGAQVEEAIRAHEPAITKDQTRHRVLEALRHASVPEPGARAEQFPHQLSGGLRQRAMIAIALAAGPKLRVGAALQPPPQRLRRRRPRTAPRLRKPCRPLRPGLNLANAQITPSSGWHIASNNHSCNTIRKGGLISWNATPIPCGLECATVAAHWKHADFRP